MTPNIGVKRVNLVLGYVRPQGPLWLDLGCLVDRLVVIDAQNALICHRTTKWGKLTASATAAAAAAAEPPKVPF